MGTAEIPAKDVSGCASEAESALMSLTPDA